MKMIAGAILILAATVLYSARWLGEVFHNSTTVGTPEAGLMTILAASLAVAGAFGIVFGMLRGDDKNRQPTGDGTRP